MEDKELQTELASIRSMMERSSRFISLSGLSGILAGVYALVGAAVAAFIIYSNKPQISPDITANTPVNGLFYGRNYTFSLHGYDVLLMLIAAAVLTASVVTGIYLSIRKAKQKGQSVWNNSSRLLVYNAGIPLFTGGLMVIILLSQYHFNLVTPAMLIFYGLALVSASNFTFSDVKYLGLMDIALGLISACLPGYGLLFWSLGFGVLHIIYGSMMYLKYDR